MHAGFFQKWFDLVVWYGNDLQALGQRQIEKANKRPQLLVFSGNLLDPCLI